MKQAPGRPSVLARKALATTSGMASATSTSTLDFVTGAKSATARGHGPRKPGGLKGDLEVSKELYERGMREMTAHLGPA